MVISCPGSEWVIRLGPFTRTNGAGSREQCVEGALRKVTEDAQGLMAQARAMVPLLLEGAICAGDCGTAEAREENADPQVAVYQLPDGKWFAIASSGQFGFKLVCRRPGV
jgi:hypothetical protein